jgi:undecaprenyl pyrophosphate phosphatase UppP
MTDITNGAFEWIAKGSGAVAGSAISLAYMLPGGRREAAIRFAVGIVSGLVFGGTAGVKIADELGVSGVLGDTDMLVTGAAFASLSAWWALGALTRYLKHAGTNSDTHSR